MKVSIDKELCTGCGLCADTCPEVFQMTDDVAEVKVASVPSSAVDSAKQAAADCPAEAIKTEG